MQQHNDDDADADDSTQWVQRQTIETNTHSSGDFVTLCTRSRQFPLYRVQPPPAWLFCELLHSHLQSIETENKPNFIYLVFDFCDNYSANRISCMYFCCVCVVRTCVCHCVSCNIVLDSPPLTKRTENLAPKNRIFCEHVCAYSVCSRRPKCIYNESVRKCKMK